MESFQKILEFGNLICGKRQIRIFGRGKMTVHPFEADHRRTGSARDQRGCIARRKSESTHSSVYFYVNGGFFSLPAGSRFDFLQHGLSHDSKREIVPEGHVDVLPACRFEHKNPLAKPSALSSDPS